MSFHKTILALAGLLPLTLSASAIPIINYPPSELLPYWPGPVSQMSPEWTGGAVVNSLWSSKSNMQSFRNAAQGRLNTKQKSLSHGLNIWSSGMGDFDLQRSSGTRDGYDYWGGGFAVGGDKTFGTNLVIGGAYGYLAGTNQSRSYHSGNDQSTHMGMIYASYVYQDDPSVALRHDFSLSFGNTSNKLSSSFGSYKPNTGKWDNTTFAAAYQASVELYTDRDTAFGPFIGIEYTASHQEGFTESSPYFPRTFNNSDLHNVSLQAGFRRTERIALGNDIKWINSLSIGYVPDLYRQNPKSTGRHYYDIDTWAVRGSNPARNAARFTWNTRIAWNANWSTFAGYQLEIRSRALSQWVNLGVSCSF